MRTFSTDDLNRIWHDILSAPITDKLSVSVINTDSRTIGAGETFVVVSGENFDAHQFIPTAIERGANAVVVEKEQDTISVPQIVVSNTRLALAQLAMAIREEYTGTVIGLTGSVGKTTNKQMLASIFAQVGNTHATKGNLNNDLGVPFTWFALPENTDYAVIEMGANHQGEIAYLANITRPHIAMITNAGQAHLEGFGGLDGVAKGKGELFESLSAGDTAIINYDDKYSQYWRELLADDVSVLTFSLENNQADVYAKNISADGSRFTLCYTDKAVEITLPTVGRHNVMNALGVSASAIASGVELTDIAKGLSVFETAKGRLQKYQRGNITIIDDTYNANPMSMRASAGILANTDGYRIMVVGDMGELGSDEIALHAQLGKDLLGKADVFFCLGEKMRAFAEHNETAQHFDELSVLCQTLTDSLLDKPSVTVLVKGSRSMKMERVVEYLLQEL
ncbi:MAG: UDP-N-acetylmuramoyl-tripeptide--D-alanyl-D-alanine ligase [Gammaproteobacteria bacterium]|nr:UDP-N-acetylmuramoyl-tripeptide--D-alanyl-D-alanine ligase [Gammaproteobacteria bacterium]